MEKSAFVFAFVAVVAFAVAPVLTQQNQTMAISIEATRSHTSQATTDSRSSPLLLLLGVMCQEVVVIETCSADGRLLVETGVRPVPVVLVGPGWE